MIYPTRRAILLAFVGAPLSLVAGLAAPGLWFVGVAWLLVVLGSVCADALLGSWRSEMQLSHTLPGALSIGGGGEARLQVTFASNLPPKRAEFSADTNAFLRPTPMRRSVRIAQSGGEARFKLNPL